MSCLAETIDENTKLGVQVQIDICDLWIQAAIFPTKQSESDCDTGGQLNNVWFDVVANLRAVKAV